MGLKEEIRTWIENLENAKKTYKPDEGKLEAIQTANVHRLGNFIYRNYREYIQFKKSLNIGVLFENLTKIPVYEIKEMKEEVKIDIRNRILKRLQSFPMDEREISRCYGYCVKPVQDRLHFITNGGNVQEVIWFTEEQFVAFHQQLIKFAMIEIDEILSLKTTSRFEKAQHILAMILLEKKIPLIDDFISEKEIKEMVDTEDERNRIKQIVCTWYNETGQTFIEELLEGIEENYWVLKKWVYLMGPEQKQKAREICIEKIKRQFQACTEKDLLKVKEIEKRLDAVLNW